MPADFHDLGSLDVLNGGSDDAEDRRAHWWLLVAAAAIVALVVGVTAAVHDRRNHLRPAPPATNHPHPSPTPTAKTLPACLTTAPTSWRTALGTVSRLGATSAFPFAISGNGTMIATRDFGTARDVVVMPPDGTPRRIFTVPEPDRQQVFGASIDSNWALLLIARIPRNANEVIPTARQLVLVNIATRATRTLVQLNNSELADPTTIDGAAIQHWPRLLGREANLRVEDRHDPGLRHRRRPAEHAPGPTGLVDAPVAHPNRVTWAGGTIENAELPPVIAHVVARDPGAARSLVSDGSAYAWLSQGRIGWWAPDETAPIELGPPPVTTEPQKFNDLLVAGQYVFVFQYSEHGSARRLIDMRTGAIAHTTVDLQYGQACRGLRRGHRTPRSCGWTRRRCLNCVAEQGGWFANVSDVSTADVLVRRARTTDVPAIKASSTSTRVRPQAAREGAGHPLRGRPGLRRRRARRRGRRLRCAARAVGRPG